MNSNFAANFLCDYLKINTAHPEPNYKGAIELFKKRALEDGFLTQEISLPSGNPVLIISYVSEDTSLPAIALNHHMDVVPALNTPEWEVLPFAGEVINNKIIGRGTQDMKGVGVAHYAALRELKNYINNFGLKLTRTIHVLLVPDEEVGGFKGVKELVNHPGFKILNIGYVLDEGLPSGNAQEILIKMEERTPIQIRAVAYSKAGHASHLLSENSAHKLLAFLSDIKLFHDKQTVLADGDTNEPGHLVSAHITSLKTNTATLNVIPSQSEATIDIRMPAHYTHDLITDWLDMLAAKHTVTYEILATSYDRFEPVTSSSILYKLLSTVIDANGLLPKPFAFEATTDIRFYSAKNIEGIGITPFTCTPNLHGTNENITVHDLELAQKIFFEFLKQFCIEQLPSESFHE